MVAMPDTGAMMCLIGMSMLHALGLRESDLIEVDLRVNAANNRKIPLLGGIFLEVEYGGRVSKQLMYVTDEVHCTMRFPMSIDFLEIHRCKNSFLAHFIVKSIHSFCRRCKTAQIFTKEKNIIFLIFL